MSGFIVFTEEQAEQAVLDSANTDFKVIPRVVDNAYEGIAAGSYVAPASILTDPEYIEFWTAKIGSLPTVEANAEDLFTVSPL